ncbi:MAG: cbb3-type cytochrome oxidase assembly protein CcoS [Candidatus Eisenbacteria bacterium]
MSVILIILPLALLVVAAAVAAYVWAARSGQFDDTDTPATRVLIDDATPAAVPGGRRADQAAKRPGGGSGDTA